MRRIFRVFSQDERGETPSYWAMIFLAIAVLAALLQPHIRRLLSGLW